MKSILHVVISEKAIIYVFHIYCIQEERKKRLLARREMRSIDVDEFLTYIIPNRPEPNLLNLMNNPGHMNS